MKKLMLVVALALGVTAFGAVNHAEAMSIESLGNLHLLIADSTKTQEQGVINSYVALDTVRTLSNTPERQVIQGVVVDVANNKQEILEADTVYIYLPYTGEVYQYLSHLQTYTFDGRLMSNVGEISTPPTKVEPNSVAYKKAQIMYRQALGRNFKKLAPNEKIVEPTLRPVPIVQQPVVPEIPEILGKYLAEKKVY